MRKTLHPATVAALWAVSNGKCYAPGCPMPVVLEVRPGVYQKNAQIAHIYGVRPGAARYVENLPAAVRDSFSNLVLLCLGHHEEVDGNPGLYPSALLKEWKIAHEGADGSVLNRVKMVDCGDLMKMLTGLAAPPLERLGVIARQLEETGTVTAETVADLKRIIRVLSDARTEVDAEAAESLAQSAKVFGADNFHMSARALNVAAQELPQVVRQIELAIRDLKRFH